MEDGFNWKEMNDFLKGRKVVAGSFGLTWRGSDNSIIRLLNDDELKEYTDIVADYNAARSRFYFSTLRN